MTFDRYKARVKEMSIEELFAEYHKLNRELVVLSVEHHKTRGGAQKELGAFSTGMVRNVKRRRSIVLTLINQKGKNKPEGY